MQGPHRQYRSRPIHLAALLALLLATFASLLTAPPQAYAASTSLVISQVYGGGGNTGATLKNDFIELYNLGSAPVSLAGWSVQYASATGSSWQVTALTGTIQPGRYYLIQEAQGAAGTVNLPTPDATGSIPMSGTAGKVALVNSASALTGSCPTTGVIDVVGFGTTANCYEGGGPTPAPSNTNAVLRANNGATDTDSNNADFASGTPNPRNSSFGAPIAPSITTQPASVTISSGQTATLSVVASGTGTLSYQWYEGATGVTTAPVGGNSASFTTPALSSTASYWVRVTDSVSSVDSATATVTVGALVACSAGDTLIGIVQGSTDTSPYAGQTVTVQGVVVGDYEGTSPALQGFYLQDAGDSNAATSDGILVYESDSANRVSLGDVVQVTGAVSEYQGQTEITATTGIESCGSTSTVTPTNVTLPVASSTALEAYEGMLVRFPQTLYVTEMFQLGRFGQVVMSSGARLPQPTNVATPGAAAKAQQAANDLNKIIVDDDNQTQNPNPIKFGRGGQPLSASNTLRGGDSASNIVGVMTYTWSGNSASGNAYRLRPVGALGGGVPNFQPTDLRPVGPPAVGGSLKVASFNVLNYFLTLDTGSATACGPTGAKQACRGANDTAELTRQQQKLNAALIKLDADVVGMMELENTQDAQGNDVNPPADIVGRLNTSLGGDVYGYVSTGIVGTDTIRVGLIYKKASVTPVGAALVDTNAIHNRPPVAQLFQEQRSGERFSVIVNHFKSKGSCPASGADNDQGDGQGCWNATRVQQAQELVSWINSTVAPTDPDVLLIGDFNSYAKEDPITTLENAGYTNLVSQFGGADAYSYVFDGQWGYLDQGLASSSLLAQVTGASDYHINSDEPSVLDYNTDFKSAGQISALYNADEFRTSDHDPVVIGLGLTASVVAPAITTQPQSQTISSGQTATLSVVATGTEPLSYQWYQGQSGTTTNPIAGATASTYTTPVIGSPTSYWVRISNDAGSVDSSTAQVRVTLDLSMYVRVGRYDLPEPTRTTAPANSLLAQEVSAVTYNWDSDTLFVVGDAGTSVVQVSKTGQLIDSMTLSPGGSPQGTEFYDPEGLTYVGNGQFVMTEERDRQVVLFTYVANTSLTRADTKTVKLGTFVQNIGLEGVSYDPATGGYILVKEITPEGVFQTGIDVVAGTATNGSPTTENSVNLFDPALTGLADFADVFALSNLPAMNGQADYGNLLVLSQEDGKIVNIDRSGTIANTLTIRSDPGNPLTVAAQQHEGLTMDRNGVLYVVSENGGGDSDHPQLWVYQPSTTPNQAATGVALNNALTSIIENSSTTAAIKVADIVVSDDGLGNNTLTLSGTDAAFFTITNNALYLKAGTVLDYETKTSYSVTVDVDDPKVGAAPDATANYTLAVTDVVNETPGTTTLIISEVAPWSSGNSPLKADWFEVSNTGSSVVNISGWKMDDSSSSFASAVALNGITSIAPGESVVFIESADSAVVASFKSLWFGANPPAGLQVGTYTGSGVGLGTGGDAVNLYSSTGVLQASVIFGASPAGAPFATFDNAAGLNNVTIAQLSALGINRALKAANDLNEIGSPGTAVTALNSAPLADAQSVTTAENTAAAITLTGSDIEGSPLTFAIVTGPANGTLTGTGTNRTYTPNANFYGSDSFTFTVNDGAADSNIATVSITVRAVTITGKPANPSTSRSAVFSFGVSDGVSVSYTCSLDGGSFASCASGASYSGLTDGSHTFVVRADDGAGVVATASYSWTIDTIAPSVTINSGPANPINSGAASFSFSSPATDVASYECKLDNADFAGCTSSKEYTGLSVGTHTFQARATDNAGNVGTAASYTWTVNAAATTTSFTTTANPAVTGQELTFKATVGVVAPGVGTPNGTATFNSGGTPIPGCEAVALSNGVARCNTSFAAAGNYIISVSYAGSSYFLASASAPGAQIVKYASQATVSTSLTPSVAGQSVTFTTKVSVGTGAKLSGSVTFLDGITVLATRNLTNGTATFSTAALSVGSHTISVVYNGSATVGGSVSPSLAQVVNQASTTTALSASANPAEAGQPVKLTAVVAAVTPGKSTPTGSVTFYEGTTTLGSASLSGGKANLNMVLGVGRHTISATYSGSAGFGGSTSAALTVVVNRAATTTTLTSSANPSTYSKKVTFSATVKPAARGAGTPSGTVAFYDGSTLLGIATLVGNKATFSITTMAKGRHRITAVYGGDPSYTTSTAARLTQIVK